METAQRDIDVARARVDEAERRLPIVRTRLETLAEAEFKQAELEADAAEIEASLPRLRAEVRQAETKLANAEGIREHAIHRASTVTGIPEETALSASVEHDSRTVPAYRTIDWIDVVATESGVVETLAVTDGAFVESPSLVLSTVDPTKVRFRAMALQADLVRLTSSARGTHRPADDARPRYRRRYRCRSDRRARSTSRTSGRSRLLATAEDARPWIRPGVSAFLEVVVDSTGGPVLAIPAFGGRQGRHRPRVLPARSRGTRTR